MNQLNSQHGGDDSTGDGEQNKEDIQTQQYEQSSKHGSQKDSGEVDKHDKEEDIATQEYDEIFKSQTNNQHGEEDSTEA
eukprot:7613326-Heterocapsa_arctica.AAC.1